PVPHPRPSRASLGVFVVVAALPLATGCIGGREAPFNEPADKAQITVMRLQGQEAPPNNGGPPARPPALPGIPPELQQRGQQPSQGLQRVPPPGLIPPGLIPGATPVQQNAPRFKNFVILAQMPLADEEAKDELLDVFGHEGNFTAEKQQCFTPGL